MYKIRDYPYLVIRDRVLFPGLTYGVDFQPGAAEEAVQAAWGSQSRTLAIFTTLVGGDGGLDDLYPIGVLAVARGLGEGSLEVEVLERVRLRDISRMPHPIAQVELMEAPVQNLTSSQAEELDSQLRSLAAKIFGASGEPGRRAASILEGIDEDRHLVLVEVLASTLAIPARDALEVLAATTVGEAQRLLLRAEKSLWSQRPSEMVRRVWLPETDEEDQEDEAASRLRNLIDELELEPEILDRLAPELERLERFDPVLFEHQETLARLEGLLAFPWGLRCEELPPLEALERALDEVVHGHERAKALLLDMMAVRYLRPDAPTPLVILAGPAGLGQGTLVRALSGALSRSLERIELPPEGGDTLLLGTPRGLAEAREGAVYRAALSASVMDPVLHLRSEFPLEQATARVLSSLTEPSSSRVFQDAYLGLPIDASQMLVVLQVRSPEMVPEPLRSRALVLELEGYTPAQRRAVLLEHLWPEALREAGLGPRSVRLPVALVDWLAFSRTREAGVRQLSLMTRQLASRLARRKASGTARPSASLAMARECLGEIVAEDRDGAAVGVVGQAVLDSGGAGVVQVAALSGLSSDVPRSRALRQAEELSLSLGSPAPAQRDWRLVCEQGALPQDEHTLSLAMALALRSASLDVPIRRDLAVAAGLGLGGEILPVSHPRERGLAAWRSGYRTLLVAPRQVELLARMLPDEVRSQMRLVPVATLEAAARASTGVDALALKDGQPRSAA